MYVCRYLRKIIKMIQIWIEVVQLVLQRVCSSRQAEYHTMQNSECDFFSHTSSLIIAFALEIEKV